jgi:hypothetical protein
VVPWRGEYGGVRKGVGLLFEIRIPLMPKLLINKNFASTFCYTKLKKSTI